MTDTSQYQEGQWIVDYFAGRIGRFLDVGAYNGLLLSNTWPLSQLGWSGVCVEPSPLPFAGLMDTHAGNDKITLINAAVHEGVIPSGSLVPFFSTGDALSTFDEEHRQKFAAYPFTEISICCGVTWKELFMHVGKDFDFLNIDVEGKNAALLAQLTIRPELICVEYDPDADGVHAVHNILKGWGYQIKEIGGNVRGVRG